MAGLLTSLPLALGLMDVADVPNNLRDYYNSTPPTYAGMQRDVPISGPASRLTVGQPTGYQLNINAINDRMPSINVEDRRYMTSSYNPLMHAADRLGPQGYYISLQYKEFAQYNQQLHEAGAQHEQQRSVARRKSK